MRKTLMTLAALLSLAAAGTMTEANAAPRHEGGVSAQPAAYYGGDWRARQWRQREAHQHWRRAHAWREHQRWVHRG